VNDRLTIVKADDFHLQPLTLDTADPYWLSVGRISLSHRIEMSVHDVCDGKKREKDDEDNVINSLLRKRDC
jgi:hypothetical protein